MSSPPSNLSAKLILSCKSALIESMVELYSSRIWRMASLAASAASWERSIVLLNPSRAVPAPAAANPVAWIASALSSCAFVLSSVDSVLSFFTFVMFSALSAYLSCSSEHLSIVFWFSSIAWEYPSIFSAQSAMLVAAIPVASPYATVLPSIPSKRESNSLLLSLRCSIA